MQLKKVKRWAKKIIFRFQSFLNPQQFLIFLAILIGLSVGMVAVFLKIMVHSIRQLILGDIVKNFGYYWWLFFPLAGIVISVFIVRNFLQARFTKGTAKVLYSISQQSSRMDRQDTYAHVITSGITVGCGGSAGLEAPIVITGAAIGSTLAQLVQANYRDRTLLLASGAAAAIAAAFNAPITGVVFALEVLLTGTSTTAYVPIMVSAVTGALCSKILLDEHVLFSFVLRQAFDYHNLPYYFLLANVLAVMALYYARATHLVERLFRYLPLYSYQRALLGGICLVILIAIFPPLFGEGYQSIMLLANGQMEVLAHNSLLEGYLLPMPQLLLLYIAAIALVKVLAVSTTLSAGGNGGNFAPSLFVGGYTGFLFARTINLLTQHQLSESNFMMVGMAGMMSGIFYAPLSAIFLILELTHGYELMIPIMLVSALTYAICRQFEPYTMDTKQLAEQGLLLTRDKDQNVLNYLKIDMLLEKDFIPIKHDATFAELLEAVTQSKRSIFPVIDTEQQFKGFILLENILPIMFKTPPEQAITEQALLQQPKSIVQIGDSMQHIMEKFDQSDAWNLPVIDQDQRYVGFVTKSRIFNKYREHLIATQQ